MSNKTIIFSGIKGLNNLENYFALLFIEYRYKQILQVSGNNLIFTVRVRLLKIVHLYKPNIENMLT